MLLLTFLNCVQIAINYKNLEIHHDCALLVCVTFNSVNERISAAFRAAQEATGTCTNMLVCASLAGHTWTQRTGLGACSALWLGLGLALLVEV